MEYDIAPSPPRQAYRTSDSLSPGMRLYGPLLRTLYVDEILIIQDLETGVGVHSLELRATAAIHVLGDGRLAVL